MNSKDFRYDPILKGLNACSEGDIRTGRDSIRDILEEAGYSDIDDITQNKLEEALSGNAVIISKSTKGVLVNKGGREAPAGVGPDKIKIGDSVQLLNWKPMGVQGATIDLFPKGKVTKTYFRKCYVKSCNKEGYEDRLEGIEIDDKGPSDVVLKGGFKVPYILKDSTVILRYPEMATPEGNTNHHSFGAI